MLKEELGCFENYFNYSYTNNYDCDKNDNYFRRYLEFAWVFFIKSHKPAHARWG